MCLPRACCIYNGILVPVRTTVVLVGVGVVVKRTMYQRIKVDADMLNAVKSMLAVILDVDSFDNF